jgi:large subunit ribosomal protein L25
MKFTCFARTAGNKINEARREGKIPAVLYGPKQAGIPFYIKKEELEEVLRSLQKGSLATTRFTLELDGKKFQALVKEVQYERATYAVEHMDFIVLHDDVLVAVNVPIRLAGMGECVGAKLGGFIRHVIRQLKVSCLPKDIPHEFVLDVQEMQIAQSKRLSEIVIPTGVKPLAKMNEVAVIIAKKG